MYVFVELDDGTPYSGAIFNYPSHLVSAPNYYWVDISDNKYLQVQYQGMWTIPAVNVNGFPSAWGEDPEAGYCTITITPGQVVPLPTSSGGDDGGGGWFDDDGGNDGADDGGGGWFDDDGGDD
jgi:hypothetical protein